MARDHDHHYELTLRWTGNLGAGTSGYRAYTRDHIISAKGKPDLDGSSDPTFRGNPARYNPEELLLAALSACHMLSYLHVCVDAGIVVEAYEDAPVGTMRTRPDGSGAFTSVTLRPKVTLKEGSDAALAKELHHKAHELCFIANSVNFPVHAEPAD